MRRVSALFVLCAWLLTSGAHWDLVQSLGWARMIVNYSQTMSVAEAVRLTFTADTLCGVCEFVADGKTRADATAPGPLPAIPGASGDSAAKGKLFLATQPEYFYVYCSVPAPAWPTEHFLAEACARPVPPVEPPRAV